MIVNLSEAEADSFFADRQAGGFNVVWINLLCATYRGGRPDGSTVDGIVPFTTPDDLATPNEAYFTRVDHMLNLAAQHGLIVLLDPAETGSFLSVLNANGVTKSRNYGRYLGTPLSQFRQHHLDERQRLPELAESQRRRGHDGGGTRHPGQ